MWLPAIQRDIVLILSIKHGLICTKNCLLDLLPKGLKFIKNQLIAHICQTIKTTLSD